MDKLRQSGRITFSSEQRASIPSQTGLISARCKFLRPTSSNACWGTWIFQMVSAQQALALISGISPAALRPRLDDGRLTTRLVLHRQLH